MSSDFLYFAQVEESSLPGGGFLSASLPQLFQPHPLSSGPVVSAPSQTFPFPCLATCKLQESPEFCRKGQPLPPLSP